MKQITLAAVRPGSPYFWIGWNYIDEEKFNNRPVHTACVQFHIKGEAK